MSRQSDPRPLMVIPVDERHFLNDYDEFCHAIVPFYRRDRKEQGLPPMDENDITNLFLSLRDKYGFTSRKDS